MNIDLVSNLVILATAIVGLYKAATFRHADDKEANSGVADAAEYMLAMAFSVIPILIVPAAMFGFIYIVKSTANFSMENTGAEERYEIPTDIPDSRIMFILSENIWKHDLRQEALHKTIDVSLAIGDYETVLKSAKDLNPTSQADDVIMKAINQLTTLHIPQSNPSTDPASN